MLQTTGAELMGVVKTSIFGSDYIGAYTVATDSFSLICNGVNAATEKIIGDALGVSLKCLSMNGTELIGIYAAANSNTLLVPDILYGDELKKIHELLSGVEIEVIDTSLNALGNNILLNDKLAIINPDYSKAEEKRIGDALGTEVIRMKIGGYSTVGANNILTKKGMVANNKATELEMDGLKKIFKDIEQSTANLGSLHIGLCVMANSKGMVAGNQTTGYELANMANALGF